MKKQLLTILTITVMAFTANAQTVTYLNFDGASTSNDRFYAFNGASATDMSDMSGTDYTFEVWIKVDATALIGDRTEATGFTANGASLMNRRKDFELYIIDDADADYAIKYNRLDATDDTVATGTMQSDAAVENLSFGDWVHVAISRSSGDGIAKFYINGVLIDSSSDALWAQVANSNEWMGFNYMWRGSNMNFYKGAFDNVRVSTVDRYPTAFTPDQGAVFTVDADTKIQLDLDHNIIEFDPVDNFAKVEVKSGSGYGYFIKYHKLNTTWTDSEVLSVDRNNLIDFSVYPNPVTEKTFVINANEGIKNVQIFDVLGKSVKVVEVSERATQLNVDVNNLSKGIYFVKTVTDAGIGTQKIIIQ